MLWRRDWHMSNIGLSSLIKYQTCFGLLVHPQCYADQALTPSSLHCVFCDVVRSIFDLFIINGSWLKVLDLLGVTLQASWSIRPCQHVEASLPSSSHSCRSDTCWNWIVIKIKRMCLFHLDLHLSVLPWFPVLETPKKSIALRMLSYLAAHWLHWLSGKCPLSAAWNPVV
jgi:hypothetical protein